MAKDDRKRTFEFVIYPDDSAPENWEEILKDTHIPMYISPLHSFVDCLESEPYKNHRHVMLLFDGKKSPSVVYEIAELVNGHVDSLTNGVVSAPVSYARYLCHLDEDPEQKPVYDTKDVIELNGTKYCYEDFVLLPRDEFEAIMNIVEFLESESGSDIKSFYGLVKYLVFNRRLNWAKIVRNNTYFFDRYLFSKNVELKQDRIYNELQTKSQVYNFNQGV